MAISSKFSAIMDELACRSFSSFTPQSPASSGAGDQHHHPVLEFEYCDVPEQWLEDDDDGVEKLWDATSSATALGNGATPPSAPAANDVSDKPAAAAPKGRRGRKPGPRTVGPVLSHVEAERQRRDRLNRRFCDLRAAVPAVSKMDRASLLADATAYIAELRARAERLEIEVKQQQAAAAAAVTDAGPVVEASMEREKLEVRMLGQRREAAALRLTTTAATPRAAARLMVAICSLDLPVQHACVCRVGGGGGTATVQDAVVDVPVALRDEALLRAVLLQSLQGSG